MLALVLNLIRIQHDGLHGDAKDTLLDGQKEEEMEAG